MGWSSRLDRSHRVAAVFLGLLISAGPLSAQDNTGPRNQAEQKDKQEVLRELREAQEDKDDPRARAEYLRKVHGEKNGVNPNAARLQAIEERNAQLREAGQQFQQAAAPGILPVRIQANSSTWTPIGPAPSINSNGGGYPNSSGRVTAIAVDPTDSNIVYVGGAQGGVWKTTNGNAADGAIIWTALTDAEASLAMGAIAIDPNNHNIIYAGTGEDSSSGDSYYGAGLLKSTDGGNMWTRISNSSTAAFDGTNGKNGFSPAIGGISIQKNACPGPTGDGLVSILMAVTYGSPAGVYRSTDGGTTWTAIATATGQAFDVQFAANNPCFAYAAIGGVGVRKSTDGGKTFSTVSGGINTADIDRIQIAVFSDQIVFAVAGTQLGDLNGVYKTLNAGTTNWTNLTIGDFCTAQCWYDLTVAVNPTDPNVVFVGGSAVNNIFVSKSVNGGSSWAGVGGASQALHVDQHAMAFSGDGSTFWAGNDGGVYRTTDAGTSTTVNWQARNDTLQLTQYYTYFTIDPADINRSFAGAQDNGVQAYDGNQSVSTAWQEVTCGDGAGAVIDFTSPTNVYADCQGVDIRKSTVGGSAGSFFGSDNGISDSTGLFIPPLVGDPTSSSRLYFGRSNVWQTNNGGSSWGALTTAPLVTCPQGNPTCNGVSNLAVAAADASGNTVYAVTSNGLFVRSLNAASGPGVATMGAVPTSGLPGVNTEYYSAIAVCPVQTYCPNQTPKSVVYLVMSGFGHGHVFKTTDASVSTVVWADISGNLPNLPVNDIALDPDIAGTIYIGTDLGVYMSANDGTTWAPLANGLPNVAVFGLKLHRSSRTLRAVTHGRGAWDLYVPFNITNGPGALTQPSALNFGKVAKGTTASPLPVNLSNNGTQTLVISGISINNVQEFSQYNNCPASLAPGASCTIEVQFTPSSAGARTGTLTITSNAVNGTQTVALNGAGAVFAQNDLFVNATVVTSGSYTDSVDTTQTTNQDGTDPVPDTTCVGVGFSGAGRFNTIWYNYTPNASGTMTVDTIGSTFDTVLTIWTGAAPGSLTAVRPINTTLNSAVVASGTQAVTPASMAGILAGQMLTIDVNANAELVTVTATTGSTFTANFTSTHPAGTAVALIGCNDDIVAGVNQQSQMQNFPVTMGTTYHLMVGGYGLNSTSSGTANFHLSGPTPIVQPSQTASPNPLLFTPVIPGLSSASQPVTLTAVNATVSSIVINASGDFSQTNNCGGTLNAGVSCTINVTFMPTALGARSGSLTITSNATNSPSNITLNGDGRDPFIIQLTRPVRPTKSVNQLVVTAGANLDIPIQITGTDDLGGSVTLGCENVPRGLTCAVEPGTLGLLRIGQLVHVVLSIGAGQGNPARLTLIRDREYPIRVVARMRSVSKVIDLQVKVVTQSLRGPGRARRIMPGMVIVLVR